MRLFTALDLPPDILLRLERLLSTLRPQAPVHWSPLSNLHITTKFIGKWTEDQMDRLDAVLESLCVREPFEVSLGGLGWFPNAHSPRVLWAGVDGGAALAQLASTTEHALVALGVARDLHSFSPHLTLARIKSALALQPLRNKVEELQSPSIGQFRALSFHLYRSDPGPDSSIYQKLRTYAFHQ